MKTYSTKKEKANVLIIYWHLIEKTHNKIITTVNFIQNINVAYNPEIDTEPSVSESDSYLICFLPDRREKYIVMATF